MKQLFASFQSYQPSHTKNELSYFYYTQPLHCLFFTISAWFFFTCQLFNVKVSYRFQNCHNISFELFSALIKGVKIL